MSARSLSQLNLAELAHQYNARKVGRSKYTAHCPGPLHKHGDRHPSLSIFEGRDGRPHVHCHVGCDAERDILNPKGLSLANLCGNREGNRSRRVTPLRPRVTDWNVELRQMIRRLAHAVIDGPLEPRDEQEGRERMLHEQRCDTSNLYCYLDRRCYQLAKQLRTLSCDQDEIAEAIHDQLARTVEVLMATEQALDEIDAALSERRVR